MKDLKFKGTKGEWDSTLNIDVNEHLVRYTTINHESGEGFIYVYADERLEENKVEEQLIADTKLLIASKDLLKALAQIQFAVKTGDVTGLFKDEIEAMDKAIEKALK